MAKKKRVEILSNQTIFSRLFFRIEEVHLRHELLNGQMSSDLMRLNLDRGDGVAALLHDAAQDKVILIEQFRYAAQGWILELPAGIISEGESPKAAIKRELVEETGYRVTKLEHISTFFPSPGGSSERIFLYYAPVTAKDRVAKGGGVPAEQEEIRVVNMKFDKALKMVDKGSISDAKTIIGLQWLANRSAR